MQSPPPPPPPPGMMPPPPPPPGGMMPPPPPPPMGGYQPAPGYAPAANYGGFWIRVVAYIIDAILVGVVAGVIDAILRINPSDTTSSSYGAASGVNLVLGIAYFTYMWSQQGATLGQRIFRLRVVDATTGQQITVGKALLRWVGLFLAFIVCFIGVIWVAFDSRKQGWADKIAGTLVLQG